MKISTFQMISTRSSVVRRLFPRRILPSKVSSNPHSRRIRKVRNHLSSNHRAILHLLLITKHLLNWCQGLEDSCWQVHGFWIFDQRDGCYHGEAFAHWIQWVHIAIAYVGRPIWYRWGLFLPLFLSYPLIVCQSLTGGEYEEQTCFRTLTRVRVHSRTIKRGNDCFLPAPSTSSSQKKGLFDDSDEDLDMFRKKK